MIDANTQFLHEHLCKEEREALRADAVEAYADGLMEEGQEYYPFNLDNFSEVLAELNVSQIKTILGYVKDTKAVDFKSAWRNETLARMINRYACNYMRDYAMKKADKEVE